MFNLPILPLELPTLAIIKLKLLNPNVKSYKKETITGKYDVIVIGSGLGGMSTAAFLAKEKMKVLVLESHY